MSQRMTFTLWAVCIIAAIGFAFDTYELLMLPLVARDALRELGSVVPGTPQFAQWFGLLFYVPAVAGGIFGLLGGYLTDRFGRRRVLTWSILLYACSAFASGYSSNLWMLLVLRTTTFVGVCVEFVAATAWLAELFDDPHQRERVLGYTQAFSSFGGVLVAVANGLIAEPQHLASIHSMFGSIAPGGGAAAWRYTLMSGLIPALPLIIFRPFLPESPQWAAKRAAGTLHRPSLRELFSPELRRTTIITTIMVAASYGVAFGAIQQLQQIVPGLDTVQAKMAAAREGKPEAEAARAAAGVRTIAAANYTKSQEIGGLVGRFALAMLVVRIASRRNLLRVFVVPGLIAVPLIFLAFARGHDVVYQHWSLNWLPGFHDMSVTLLGIGIFFAGFFTVAQFSFWGNYLPRAFPLHLRGTGESFAANVGGRMLGTPFAFLTQMIATSFLGEKPTPVEASMMYAKVAAGVALVLYLVNLILSWALPEQSADQTTNSSN
jgi:MFS family permease